MGDPCGRWTRALCFWDTESLLFLEEWISVFLRSWTSALEVGEKRGGTLGHMEDLQWVDDWRGKDRPWKGNLDPDIYIGMSQMSRRILPCFGVCVLNRMVCTFLLGYSHFSMCFLWTNSLQLKILLFELISSRIWIHLLQFDCSLYLGISRYLEVKKNYVPSSWSRCPLGLWISSLFFLSWKFLCILHRGSRFRYMEVFLPCFLLLVSELKDQSTAGSEIAMHFFIEADPWLQMLCL